ncbi:amidase [Leptospira barantonii]|uniref:Amidase n=1 Tax=Leptospira barantonii TaxID=2023184 RepID=A0A5F2AZG3_9LEPT|nr:amidase [Leptospira barantonii]TGL96291.1 amidase [Leptospira barantonii]
MKEQVPNPNENIKNTEYTFLSINELGELIRSRKVSPVTIVSDCLERIERLNPRLNAFITVTAEQALQEAELAEREIEKGNWKGPLHGVPIGIKDMFDTAGIKTTAAFVHFQNRIPKRDAIAVIRLKEAGAIVIGKTNQHELAAGTTSIQSHYGTVHNPWNPNYIAGGSSGGSAAAVASGLCYATLDTDAIGSCRLPASCCGVVGFKATYGLLNLQGVLEGEPVDEAILTLAHAGVMTRSAEDTAILFKVLLDPQDDRNKKILEWKFDTNQTTSFKIGFPKTLIASDEIRTNFEIVKKKLASLGNTLCEIEVPLSPSFDLSRVQEHRAGVAKILFSDCDVLILPTTTETVLKISDASSKGPLALSSANTFFANYYGIPAISVPSGFSLDGLPIGFQIVAGQNEEEKIFELANRYQNEADRQLRHPIL